MATFSEKELLRGSLLCSKSESRHIVDSPAKGGKKVCCSALVCVWLCLCGCMTVCLCVCAGLRGKNACFIGSAPHPLSPPFRFFLVCCLWEQQEPVVNLKAKAKKRNVVFRFKTARGPPILEIIKEDTKKANREELNLAVSNSIEVAAAAAAVAAAVE